MKSLFCTICLLLDTFSYDHPNEWYRDNPQCAGHRQSPISICHHKAVRAYLPALTFGYYDACFPITLELCNKGRTVEIHIPVTEAGEKAFITGGLLTDVYQAEEVHFHWGTAMGKGSEHLINDRRYDIEMHIVHKNVNYQSLEEALKHPDGIAVLAVFFKAVKHCRYYRGLNDIFNTLDDIVQFQSTSNLENILTLDALLGDINREEFYTYRGSLTTPPCSEAVIWTIFPDPLLIPYEVLPKFTQLTNKRGLTIKNNFRPVQPIKKRKIFHRKPCP